jgi:hypothetical protein
MHMYCVIKIVGGGAGVMRVLGQILTYLKVELLDTVGSSTFVQVGECPY